MNIRDLSRVAAVSVFLLISVSLAYPLGAIDRPINSRIKAAMDHYRSEQHAPYIKVCSSVIASAPVHAALPARGTRYHVVHMRVEEPTDIYLVVEREARRVGVAPEAMYAIEVHETGNFRSPKWCRWRNPGGIEYRKTFDEEGIPCEKHGRWAGFSSVEDGIRAHAMVLAHHRYAKARQSPDPYRQVEGFGQAGYCEPGYNWTAQVKAHLRRLFGHKA